MFIALSGAKDTTEVVNLDKVVRATMGIGAAGHPRIEIEFDDSIRCCDGEIAMNFADELLKFGILSEAQKPVGWPGPDYRNPENPPWEKEAKGAGGDQCGCPECAARRASGDDGGMPDDLSDFLFGGKPSKN